MSICPDSMRTFNYPCSFTVYLDKVIFTNINLPHTRLFRSFSLQLSFISHCSPWPKSETYSGPGCLDISPARRRFWTASGHRAPGYPTTSSLWDISLVKSYSSSCSYPFIAMKTSSKSDIQGRSAAYKNRADEGPHSVWSIASGILKGMSSDSFGFGLGSGPGCRSTSADLV